VRQRKTFSNYKRLYLYFLYRWAELGRHNMLSTGRAGNYSTSRERADMAAFKFATDLNAANRGTL
jgi:hypothetical protein